MKWLLILGLVSGTIFARSDAVNDALNYYPLQTGNYWEYKEYYWIPFFQKDSSAFSLEVTGDTILSNNKSYKILLYKKIPYSGQSGFIYERIDSTSGAVYRFTTDTGYVDNEYMIDSLFAQPGDYFAGSREGESSFGQGIFSTLCFDEYEDTYLGLTTSVKEYDDQSVIPSTYYNLAKGLGFVHSSSFEFESRIIAMIYAIIDGIEYGEKITGVENNYDNNVPAQFKLYQNYPNPFNPVTKIKFSIPQTDSPLLGGARGGLTTLKVYDILGNEAAILVNEQKEPGIYEVIFDASNLSSGVYYYRIIRGSYSETKKMILLN